MRVDPKFIDQPKVEHLFSERVVDMVPPILSSLAKDRLLSISINSLDLDHEP